LTVIFKEHLPRNIPKSVPIYRLSKLDSSPRGVAGLAKHFGLEGGSHEYHATADWSSYVEGRYTIEVHKRSGALYFRNEDKYGIQMQDNFELSDQEAKKIADKFMRTTGIMPRDEVKLLRITHLRGMVKSITSSSDQMESVLDAGVLYGRIIDKIPVEGPGGKAMVNINAEGDIVGMTHLWRPLLKKHSSVNVKSTKSVLKEIGDHFSNVKGNVTVTKARFGYFEQDKYDTQTLLQPVYTFIYNVEYEEVAKKHITVLPAGDKVYAQLKGRKRFPAKEVPRDI
jgi:hypothetical protein